MTHLSAPMPHDSAIEECYEGRRGYIRCIWIANGSSATITPSLQFPNQPARFRVLEPTRDHSRSATGVFACIIIPFHSTTQTPDSACFCRPNGGASCHDGNPKTEAALRDAVLPCTWRVAVRLLLTRAKEATQGPPATRIDVRACQISRSRRISVIGGQSPVSHSQ